MLSFSRMILTVGSLVASASLAQARDHALVFPSEGPVPVERPMLLGVENFGGAMVAKPANPAQRPKRARAPGIEEAARTPEETRTVTDGNHEAAAPTLSDLVARYARENGVPFNLAEAVVRIESRGNPLASHGGALGLMQIKPGTARAAGFSGGASSLFVADTNLHFGMKILGDAFRSSGGDVCRALMLYQSGHLATRMTRANRAYCGRARAVMSGT